MVHSLKAAALKCLWIRKDQIINGKVSFWQTPIFYGRMTFLSKALLICLWLSPAIAYKLPLLNEAILTDDDDTTDKPNNSPSGMNYQWEWQSQDRMDEGTLMSARLRRDAFKRKDLPDKIFPPKVITTEPPLDDLSDSTPHILEASSASFSKVKSMLNLKEDETTAFTNPKQATKGAGKKVDEDETTPLTDLENTSEETGKKLEEDETTPSIDLMQTTKAAGEELIKEETTHVDKSVTQIKTSVTELKPTISEKLSVSTINEYKKATTDHSTNSQDTSDPSTSPNEILLKDITSSISPTAQETSPSSTPVISHDLTTGHDVTTVGFMASSGSSAKPAAVTYVTSFHEEKIHTQSIMRQCMLTILILAVVCTIFIISTIALAAKLSAMKQKNKLRHPVTYTEMRCISSLLPDSDQQNKPQHKRLKTFANIEESDGDNTTLNSFLPDH